MQVFTVGNFGMSQIPALQKVAAAINGKTFMNFQVTIAIFEGNAVVNVQANAESEAEAKDMFMFTMMGEMAKIVS